VIPIISLRERFGLGRKDNDKRTRIIVMNISGKVLGIIVDSVSEVLRLNSNTVEPAPEVVSGKGEAYIKGVGKVGEKLLILLDLERLFGDVEKMLEDVINPTAAQ
jgi:purine-binding chemotaxis protein CheW